jgi:hypothetical protein
MTLDILDEFDKGVLRESGMTAFGPIAACRGGDRCGFCTEGSGDRLLSARQSGDPVMVGYWMTPDDEANGSSG